MRNINSILFFAVLSLLFSCTKKLDLPPDGRITMKDVFNDYNRTRGYLNSCYGFCPVPGTERSSLTDDSYDAEDVVANNRYLKWYKGNVTSSNYGSISPDGSPWGKLFQGIRKCNVFLENLPNTPDFELASDVIKEGWAAQAHTLRALYYLQLLKRYEAVPIIDKDLPIGDSYSTVKRATASEVVKFILEDCREALSAPDGRDGFHWEIYSNQDGMMTRGIAYAIMSEAITYAASPLFSDGTYTWDDATKINAEALGELLSNGYKLFDVQPEQGAAVNSYALYFLTNPNNHAVDKETIYALGSRQQVWRYSGLPSTPNQERAGHCPTQDLVDAYEMANGKSPIVGYKDADHLVPEINPASGYDEDNPYINRDPRFYATIFYNNAPRISSSGIPKQPQELPLSLQMGSQNQMNIQDNGNGDYTISTTGTDPYIQTSALGTDLNAGGTIKLTFEYKSTTGINSPELFFSPIAGGRSTVYADIPPSADWTIHSIDIGSSVGQFTWGKAGDNLRFDVGADPNKDIQIRNIIIKTDPELSGSDKVETYVGGDDEISSSNRRNTRTGYYLRKYFNHASNISNQADGYTRLFRLAEIYLNFAESAYHSKGPDISVKVGNNEMSARDAVDVVRNRAGMPDFPIGMSKDEFETKYRNERRIEFSFEGQRFFDVRRWKVLDKTGKFVTGMKITKNNDGSFSYNRFRFSGRNAWHDKYLLYPIPKSEVDKVLKSTGENWQNPGWAQ